MQCFVHAQYILYVQAVHKVMDAVIIQVVLRRDLVDGHSPAVEALRPGGSLHMAHTDYEVLSVSGAAPRRSCLMLIQPVTGSLW